jgi:hypothetical protein
MNNIISGWLPSGCPEAFGMAAPPSALIKAVVNSFILKALLSQQNLAQKQTKKQYQQASPMEISAAAILSLLLSVLLQGGAAIGRKIWRGY